MHSQSNGDFDMMPGETHIKREPDAFDNHSLESGINFK